MPSDKLTLQKHKTFELKETYMQSDPLLVSAKKLVLVPERESGMSRPTQRLGSEIKPSTRLNSCYAFPGPQVLPETTDRT